MRFFDLDKWEEIWVTITRNKVRSLLTSFGVFWGIFMLVILVGSGNGLGDGLFQFVKGFATNSSFFYSDVTSEPYKGYKKGRRWSIRFRDVDMIKQTVGGIEYISPMLFMGGQEGNISYKGKAANHGIKGIAADYFKIETQKVLYGRLLNDLDISENRKVCVIGSTVYDNLFPKDVNPIGEYVKIFGIYYQVIGVTMNIPQISIGGQTKEMIVLPITTMRDAFAMGDNVHFLSVTTAKGFSGEDLRQQISTILKANNSISATDMQAVGSFNIEQQAQVFEMLFLGINILIWVVGMGTLLSGVVGVSNIMLVTVKERTKEIGVRRALGAQPFEIIGQIMTESLVLTLLAGMAGLSLGVLILDLAGPFVAESSNSVFLPPQIDISTAIAATIVLLISGLAAGLIPASRAMRIKPIEAIREE